MSEPRSLITLAKRPASCCRCGRRFRTEINPPIHNDFGELIRGERQVSRMCPGCRADDGFDYERGRKVDDAHAQG